MFSILVASEPRMGGLDRVSNGINHWKPEILFESMNLRTYLLFVMLCGCYSCADVNNVRIHVPVFTVFAMLGMCVC